MMKAPAAEYDEFVDFYHKMSAAGKFSEAEPWPLQNLSRSRSWSRSRSRSRSWSRSRSRSQSRSQHQRRRRIPPELAVPIDEDGQEEEEGQPGERLFYYEVASGRSCGRASVTLGALGSLSDGHVAIAAASCAFLAWSICLRAFPTWPRQSTSRSHLCSGTEAFVSRGCRCRQHSHLDRRYARLGGSTQQFCH